MDVSTILFMHCHHENSSETNGPSNNSPAKDKVDANNKQDDEEDESGAKEDKEEEEKGASNSGAGTLIMISADGTQHPPLKVRMLNLNFAINLPFNCRHVSVPRWRSPDAVFGLSGICSDPRRTTGAVTGRGHQGGVQEGRGEGQGEKRAGHLATVQEEKGTDK